MISYAAVVAGTNLSPSRITSSTLVAPNTSAPPNSMYLPESGSSLSGDGSDTRAADYGNDYFSKRPRKNSSNRHRDIAPRSWSGLESPVALPATTVMDGQPSLTGCVDYRQVGYHAPPFGTSCTPPMSPVVASAPSRNKLCDVLPPIECEKLRGDMSTVVDNAVVNLPTLRVVLPFDDNDCNGTQLLPPLNAPPSPPSEAMRPPLSKVEPTEATTTSTAVPSRSRKPSKPHRAPSRRRDRIPGVVLQFALHTADTTISIIKRPEDYITAGDDAVTRQRKRMRRKRAQSDSAAILAAASTTEQHYDTSFPTSEEFCAGFADTPSVGDSGTSGTLASSSLSMNSSSCVSLISKNRMLDAALADSMSSSGSSSTTSTTAFNFSGDAAYYDDLDGRPRKYSVGSLGKKKQQQGMVVKKQRQTKTTARSAVDKVCLSCRCTSTPIWREVKEGWGDRWDQVLLCNACGLQWRMSGLRCTDCLYVPRASEKRAKKCTRCENGKWYRKC